MKFIRIFVSRHSADGIWSIHLHKRKQNEFEQFFDLMNDVEWLYQFFEENKTDLHSGFFGKISVAEAVLVTLDEASKIEDALYNYAENGFVDHYDNLQQFFKPLNNFEYTITVYQKSKARIRDGWLRVYAVRLAKNCYVVTGGSIKLTLDMKEII